MTKADLLRHISIDPNVAFGKPCIRGTRIWVGLIVETLSQGESEAAILAAYPQLTTEDIHAALLFAAEMTNQHIVPLDADRA